MIDLICILCQATGIAAVGLTSLTLGGIALNKIGA
jgi:hypothetical protein